MVKTNTAEVAAIVKSIKQEHQNLATRFSEHALAEIAKKEIIKGAIPYQFCAKRRSFLKKS